MVSFDPVINFSIWDEVRYFINDQITKGEVKRALANRLTTYFNHPTARYFEFRFLLITFDLETKKFLVVFSNV